MPHFTHAAPEPEDTHVFRIVRTPPTAAIQAIVTVTDIVGCYTHFANNRTIPCERPADCPLCNDGWSKRWHGYLACIITSTLEHVLFEFTAAASDTFTNYYRLHNTMRACLFHASRPSKRPNGRVVIRTTPGDESRHRLPDPPDIKRILCHIWGVRYATKQPTGMTRPPCKDIRPGGNGHDPTPIADSLVNPPDHGFRPPSKPR